jgi:uncharacterized alpha-E superfamily protein
VRAATVSEFLVFDPDNPGAITSVVARARENARSARELVPTELWEAINGFHLELRARNLRAEVEVAPTTSTGSSSGSARASPGWPRRRCPVTTAGGS